LGFVSKNEIEMGETVFSTLKENYFVHFALLLLAVFVFVGKPVPYSNDFSYLLQLASTYNPDFLSNDITFSAPANERWLFNHIFGVFTLFLSIEFVGWVGRILCWSGLLIALLKLGKRWEIPLWMISLSIFIWLCFEQSIVADEWMFGGFEAKCVAYILLLFAIDRFCDGRDLSSAILLGLTFSFHPIVGLWGISAALIALFIHHWDLLRTLKVVGITAAFSLFGLIPLFIMRANSQAPTSENLEFLQLVKFPFHFDPLSWAKSSILLVILFIAFCLFVHFRDEKQAPNKILILFLSALGLFFFVGILLRLFNQFALLELMPMRLFPLFAPLFFLFYLGKAFKRNSIKNPLVIGLLAGILFLTAWTGLPLRAVAQIQQNQQSWTEKLDDTAEVFIWLRENTKSNAVVIAPPWRFDYWYLSRRPSVVNYYQPIYSNLNEWQTRLNSLVGPASEDKEFREDEELSKFYNALTEENVKEIAGKYEAKYLVSESDYDFPVLFSKGKVKIYSVGDKR